MEEPDQGHRRLLRTHGERPHRRRAAEQGDKLASPHIRSQAQETAS
jgi:hypothetical protein